MVHGKASIKAHPIVVGGGIFPIENLTTLNMLDRSKIRASVRGWEKAGSTKDDSAYTAGVLMHAMNDKTYVVEHVARGRSSALDREQKIKFYAQVDAKMCSNYQIVIEQEPG
jgi:phage terminase large subunit-like protein